jgi:hypothetical protein
VRVAVLLGLFAAAVLVGWLAPVTAELGGPKVLFVAAAGDNLAPCTLQQPCLAVLVLPVTVPAVPTVPPTPSQLTPKTVYVAAGGSNHNPCTRTAPCADVDIAHR